MARRKPGRTKFTAYITKYALTAGITKVRAEDCFDTLPGMIGVPLNDGVTYYSDDRDWHRTRKKAIARAEEMRAAEIVTLENKIENLRKIRFA